MQNISSLTAKLDGPFIFCENGDFNVISATTAPMSFEFGIDSSYAQNFGNHIKRSMINAIGRMGSAATLFRFAGGVYGFSTELLSDKGYPSGCVVETIDGTTLRKYYNSVGGNKSLPVSYDNTGIWKKCDGRKRPDIFITY